MHARHVALVSILAAVSLGCPRWDIHGKVVQREDVSVGTEEPIKGALAQLKCGAPPAALEDAGVAGALHAGSSRTNFLFDDAGTTTDAGDDAGTTSDAGTLPDAGVADAGDDAGNETQTPEPNDDPESAFTGSDGTFALGRENETGPHQNCTVTISADGFVTRVYDMDKICAEYQFYEGVKRCRYGFVLAEMDEDPAATSTKRK